MAITLAVLLLFASGFVSASEIAFFSLSPSDLNEIEEESHTSDKYIKSLLNDSETLLATILISNNFVNVTIIMLCNYFFASVIDFGNAVILEFLVITVILTYLLLLFGEIMPKIYSAQHTLSFARMAAPVINVLRKVFYPISCLLVKSTFIVNKLVSKKNYNLSVDDLSQALELTDKNEISEESNILEGIIRFGGETAVEVMTSRLDMVDLEINTPFSEVLKCVVDNAYSRIPIYEGSRDNIKGILYIKDLLPHLSKGDNFRWQTLVRAAYFVPETKMIDDLLRDFQANKIHIAIVVDEFGGTSGIVTMEDIIEELVGEIYDEYDAVATQDIVQQQDGSYRVLCATNIDKMFDFFDVEEEIDATTVNGWVVVNLDKLPEVGDTFENNGLLAKVTKADGKRALEINVKVLPKIEEEEEEK